MKLKTANIILSPVTATQRITTGPIAPTSHKRHLRKTK